MPKLIVPIVALVGGLSAGVGVGVLLAPSPAPTEVADVEHPNDESETQKEKPAAAKSKGKTGKKGANDGTQEYLKLTKQFVVPVLKEHEIAAMVTMSLSLEADPAIADRFYAIEPKLRDGFLQVLFDHANSGGFDGVFTRSDYLESLRKSLLEVARKDLGDDVSQVLITSVNRQNI